MISMVYDHNYAAIMRAGPEVCIKDIFMCIYGLYRQVNVFERTQAYCLNVRYN